MKRKYPYLFFIAFLGLFLFSLNVCGQTFVSSFKDVQEIASLNEKVLFAADDGVHGLELWVTNGDQKNTSLLKDIRSGLRGSTPSNFIFYKDRLYFSAFDDINGSELWKTDGTPEGTVMMKDIRPGAFGSSPQQFVLFDDELYFVASEDAGDGDLWKTNGTPEGTSKVYETGSLDIRELTVVGDHLFFIRSFGPNQLWKLNRHSNEITEQETDDHYNIQNLKSLNNSLLLTTNSTNNQSIRLYNLNPENGEIVLLQEFARPVYGSLDIDNFIEVNTTYFFSLRTDYDNDPETDVLWKTDGTVEGTSEVKSFLWDRHWSNSYMQNFISLNDQLFFRGSSGVSNFFWKSDGTKEGTNLVHEVNIDEYVEPISSNGKIYFASESGYLWESDGTSSGTKKYFDIKLSTYTDPTVLYDVSGTIYFKGKDDELGESLWSSKPNSEIVVSRRGSEVKNGENLTFTSRIDELINSTFTIKNAGKKELTLSKVFVTGAEFYLGGNPKQVLSPDETTEFTLYFFPNREGRTESMLEIQNNDMNEGIYTIKISGTSSGIGSNLGGLPIDFNKVLHPEGSSGPLKLEPYTVVENSEPNHLIGSFSADQGINFEYTLAEGSGDRDNALFIIDGNHLILRESVDYEITNILNIRVEAKASSGETSYQQAFIIDVLNENEDMEFTTCSAAFNSMSYSLNSVAYINESTLIAVGNSGVIIKSTDAGENWQLVNSDIYGYLRSVQFTNEQIGYIIGDNGAILKTDNGGDDWFALSSPNVEYPYLTDLYFTSPEAGYVYGRDGKAFRTLDGGMTWESVKTGYNDLAAGYFFDEDRGFVCGESSTLRKTDDGGQTWEAIDMNAIGRNIKFVDIQFVSDQIGYILGDDGEIIKTEDGGESWTQVGEFLTTYAVDLHFLSETTGYAIAGWNSSNIYKTTDGGVTWTAEETQSIRGTILSIDFSPDQSKACVVGYGSGLGETAEDGRTIASLKNGQWELHSSLMPENYLSAEYINDTHAFIFGAKNFRTANGGLTWNEFTIDNSTGIRASQFLNENIGFATDRYNVFKTTDSGAQWVQIEDDAIDSPQIRGVYFFDENLGFVFGWETDIYRTINGGDTWTKISDIGGGSSIDDMVFLSASKGFAVSTVSAEVIKTEDGGLTWETLNSYYLKSLYTIKFIDNLTGVALGKDGFELRTVDGGASWQEIKTGIGFDFKSVHFVNSTTGYAACSNGGGTGAVYKTTDAGLSWDLIRFTDELYDLGAYGDKVLFSGERGALFQITNNSSPTVPGYIDGQDALSLNSIGNYEIPKAPGTQYRWEVEGTNKVAYQSNQANVEWSNTGTYKLTVTPYNSCGTGESRTIEVTIDDIPIPSITGAGTVEGDDIGIPYQTDASEGSRFTWNVVGAQKYEALDHNISVDWMNADLGRVDVVETRIKSGTRGFASLDVIIIKKEVLTSVDIKELANSINVYPNPTVDYVRFGIDNSLENLLAVRIFDTSGKAHGTFQIDLSANDRIDLRELPAGLYLIELSGRTGKATARIIKK